MQEENEHLCSLETAVEELLTIVKAVQNFSSEMQKIEKFLNENKKRVVTLGKIVAVHCGISPTAKEALLFGKLIMANLLFNNIKSIDFLSAALEQTISAEELKTKIVEFVREIDRYLTGDKKIFVKQIEKEIKVLEKIKGAVKGAKYDPEWRKEIETLENKMRSITVTLSGKKKNQQKSEKNKKLTQQEYQKIMHTLDVIADFRCFCNFRMRNIVSKYAVLREILMQFFETQTLNYLYVLPRMCGQCTKTNIEMCAPVLVFQTHISMAQIYMIEILRKLTKIEKSCEEETELIIENMKRTGLVDRNRLGDLLSRYAPKRKPFIIQMINSQKETFFYTNIIRILYLIISDISCMLLFQCCRKMKKNCVSVLLGANYIYHRSLLQYHAKKENVTNVEQLEKGTLSALIAEQYFFDGFRAVKIVTDGIFITGSLLFPYFHRYHTFRVSILHSMLDILSKKLAKNALERYCMQQKKNVALNTGKKLEDVFYRLVRRRLLNILRILSIRFLRSKKGMQEFLCTIDKDEFERRGLFGHTSEVSVFISASFPLIFFGIFSLYRSDAVYLHRQ